MIPAMKRASESRLLFGLGKNVVALAVVSLLTDVSSEMIYPLLPVFLATTLGAGALSVGVIEGVAQLVASTMGAVSGRWSDGVARRQPLVLLGYVISSAVRPLVGVAQSGWHVLGVRVIDRVGKGIRTSPRDALIADSVSPAERGRAFGFHRAADHAGAVLGPLVAFALLQWAGLPLRVVFLCAAIPAALAVVVILGWVRDVPRARHEESAAPQKRGPIDRPLARYLAILGLFTLGNASDAFLLLKARESGIAVQHVPLLWAFLHISKSLSSTPGGRLSDRIGRKPAIVIGWGIYAFVYWGFSLSTSAAAMWALVATYGLYFGLTEGSEKALVADLSSSSARGAAFGWFNLVIGGASLPASIAFGLFWDRFGSSVAFQLSAILATVAGILLVFTVNVGPRRTTP